VEFDIYFSQPSASVSREKLTYEKIAESAELAVNKLHREVNWSLSINFKTLDTNIVPFSRPRKAR
jgi:hypothetical protein